MRGADGISAAQWVSSVLSLVAVGIALYVFLAQQRAANVDRVNEASRERIAIEGAERERIALRQHLYAVVLQVMEDAVTVLTTGVPSANSMMSVDWLSDRGTPLKLLALRGTLGALRQASTSEVELILALSKAIAVLDGAIRPPGWGNAPIEAVVHGMMKRTVEELAVVIGTVRALKGAQVLPGGASSL